ncbi:MAG: hypothetical protein BWY70_01339 [Bacteroidetes bacterium ADurb.Bin408]|nr:MAG: hypothetical protein BWY70_01339 [Bacteroidetes bacterium ADurb.Bin408]
MALISVFIAVASQAQKVHVLYFKANLACCAAKACANLEGQVKSVVEKNFKSTDVAFKTVMLSDSANTALVNKYNAKSQTVVILQNKKKNAQSKDVSELVKEFSRSKDEAVFEKEMIAAIKELLK